MASSVYILKEDGSAFSKSRGRDGNERLLYIYSLADLASKFSHSFYLLAIYGTVAIGEHENSRECLVYPSMVNSQHLVGLCDYI